MKDIVLTGVKPTGTPHIGNYFGAIRPALELSAKYDCDSFLFIADYHALNTIKNPRVLKDNCLAIAATWLACGLDPKSVVFYRQSDVPEVFELNWILSNITPKGLLNRAHAYKASVDENVSTGKDVDAGINMGLFNYPVLMAADILIMKASKVPVGLDQKQHLEITKEIARLFENTYGKCFVMPQELISENVGTIVGLDGRKMSKSYGNVIPLFSSEANLKKDIFKIVTNSQAPTEPKSTDCAIFEIFKLFASENEIDEMKKKFAEGIGWGEVKTKTFEVANRMIAPMREKYEYYVKNPNVVEDILKDGAKRARQIANETLCHVRELIGK